MAMIAMATAHAAYGSLPEETRKGIEQRFASEAFKALSTEKQQLIQQELLSMLITPGATTSAILDKVSSLIPGASVTPPAGSPGLIASVMDYFWKPAPVQTSDQIAEEFEVIPTYDEALAQKRQAIIDLTDTVFISTAYDKVTYSYDDLRMGGAIHGDNPIPFSSYNEKPYQRRCAQVGSIYQATSNFQKMLSEHMVKTHLGMSGKTPTTLLQGRLEARDPDALRISAMLYQLGDDADMKPTLPSDHLSELDGRVVAVPYEVGQIELNGLKGFTIKGDQILIAEMDGTVIGSYRVDRTVTIGYSGIDGLVECDITRTFERIYPSVE